jgi:hypothetical protein
LEALNFKTQNAGLPECLKLLGGCLWWVGDDESGPAELMMWILSAARVGDEDVQA